MVGRGGRVKVKELERGARVASPGAAVAPDGSVLVDNAVEPRDGSAGNRGIGNARALSDGVGNAYVVDVWTHSRYRGLGIGTALMNALLEKLHGQHVYLQTDDAAGFYRRLGFTPQPEGLHKIVGDYLDRPPE